MVFCGPHAEEVARSLEPDNMPGMTMEIERESFSTEICTEKIGTLLATADDLLMNIKIAEETLISLEEK
jgi:hypothetical protein